MLNLGMNNLWPTPVYLGDVGDKELLERLLHSTFLNVDLDHPTSDFQAFDILHDGPEEFTEFKDKVVYPAFKDYLADLGYDIEQFPNARMRSWITGVRNHYHIPIHNHSGSSFSAVFYLMCEEKSKGGELIMVDPRANANRGYEDEFKPLFANETFLPSSGQYVIFPSYLYHHTLPFTGSMRLAMPVDLFL